MGNLKMEIERGSQASFEVLNSSEMQAVDGGLTLKAFGYQLDILWDNELHVWAGTYNPDGSAHSVRII